MEEFFLKAAALMEEFYWLGLMYVLVAGANALANVIRATNSSSRKEVPADNHRILPLEEHGVISMQEQLDRIEKKLSESEKP